MRQEITQARQNLDLVHREVRTIDTRRSDVFHRLVRLQTQREHCGDAELLARVKAEIGAAEDEYEVLTRTLEHAQAQERAATVRLRGITDALARRPAEMKQLRDQLHGYENLLQENEARVQAARRALSSAESRLAATQHEHESLAAHLKALEAEEHDALAAA